MVSNRTKGILSEFEKLYGTGLRCYLNYETPWQLLVATILSAQCTDERVNVITADLFKKYPAPGDFAAAKQKELEEDIKSAGLFKNKAANIIACATIIHEEYEDTVPDDIDILTKLPGVGRKTANVIRGNIYGIPSIVVDTHVKRISKRLGLTKEDDPVKIEKDLMKKVPKEYWILINLWFITFGRRTCKAQSPKCQECPVAEYCRYPR